MEKTLVILKPGAVQRALVGEVTARFERKGLRLAGMKMMQLTDELLNEHYAHLVGKPFFPALKASMMRTGLATATSESCERSAAERFVISPVSAPRTSHPAICPARKRGCFMSSMTKRSNSSPVSPKSCSLST